MLRACAQINPWGLDEVSQNNRKAISSVQARDDAGVERKCSPCDVCDVSSFAIRQEHAVEINVDELVASNA